MDPSECQGWASCLGPKRPLPMLAWQMRFHPSAPIGVPWQFDVPCPCAAWTVDGKPLLLVQIAHHDQFQPIASGNFFKSTDQLGSAHLPTSRWPVQQHAGQQEEEFPPSFLPDNVTGICSFGFQSHLQRHSEGTPQEFWDGLHHCCTTGENCSTINVIQLWESPPHRSTSGTHCGQRGDPDQSQQWGQNRGHQLRKGALKRQSMTCRFFKRRSR